VKGTEQGKALYAVATHSALDGIQDMVCLSSVGSQFLGGRLAR
jgi:hypothetical protein